jgi:hypothetical protein
VAAVLDNEMLRTGDEVGEEALDVHPQLLLRFGHDR